MTKGGIIKKTEHKNTDKTENSALTTTESVVKVHESVLASIVRKATCSVKGVVRLSGSSFVDNIAEIVGSKKMFDRSIAIEMGDSSVQVEVRIVVEYGTYIPAVAENVQAEVIAEVTKITGMAVTRINVIVMDLDDASAQEED